VQNVRSFYEGMTFKGENKMKILIAVLLIVHGLIVASQSSGSFNPAGGLKNPSWLSWWPAHLG